MKKNEDTLQTIAIVAVAIIAIWFLSPYLGIYSVDEPTNEINTQKDQRPTQIERPVRQPPEVRRTPKSGEPKRAGKGLAEIEDLLNN